MGDLKEKQQRMTGPDIVRTVAAFFVVAVHFYLSCGYYQTPMVGKKMFIMSCARWLFMPCVPLYMMLTGFFKSKKKISKDHYMSLVPILVAYVIISVIKVFVANHFYGKINFFKDTMIRLTDYSFAWYVGMYICMILLIPFLNILWEGLKSDKEKYILLLSLIAICSVSTVVPVIIPKYFQMLYPIMYYYIGVWIREKRPKVNKLILLFVIGVTVLISAVVTYKGAKGGVFDWTILASPDSGYPVFTLMLCSTAIFLLLYDIDIKNSVVSGIFRGISQVSFEIYMFTGVFDVIIYTIAYRYVVNDANLYFYLFFLLVPLNFILSLAASLIYRAVYRAVVAGLKGIKIRNNDTGSGKEI